MFKFKFYFASYSHLFFFDTIHNLEKKFWLLSDFLLCFVLFRYIFGSNSFSCWRLLVDVSCQHILQLIFNKSKYETSFLVGMPLCCLIYFESDINLNPHPTHSNMNKNFIFDFLPLRRMQHFTIFKCISNKSIKPNKELNVKNYYFFYSKFILSFYLKSYIKFFSKETNCLIQLYKTCT